MQPVQAVQAVLDPVALTVPAARTEHRALSQPTQTEGHDGICDGQAEGIAVVMTDRNPTGKIGRVRPLAARPKCS